MSTNKKVIDYLYEDPEIPHQRFALVSIVGPHMPQKCDVWGLKIRGVTDNIKKAEEMTKKLMKIDNDYDIYTVEVGKFFPLAIEPHEVGHVEYQNDQLNALVKSYLENREMANQEWNKRKNDMIKEAIKEGKNQEEIANRPEHPVAVLQRIRDYEQRIQHLKEDLESIVEDLNSSRDKYDNYTDEQRLLAEKELSSAVETVVEEQQEEGKEKELTLDEIRKELMSVPATDEQSEIDPVPQLLNEIRDLEQELDELQTFQCSITESQSPVVYRRLLRNIVETQEKIKLAKSKLTNKEIVNKFINSNYKGSQYAYLENKEPSTSQC